MAGSGGTQMENGEGPELLTFLNLSLQNAEGLVQKNVGFKKEIERLKNENELVQGKFKIEASGRLKFQKKFEEFKVLNSRLRDEKEHVHEKEMERMKFENDILHGKFDVEVSGRLKLQKELEECNMLVSRLRKERDGYKENEDYSQKEILKLQRKICEGEGLMELNSRLREERDELCNRLKEKDDDHKEIIELRRQIGEWERLEKLNCRMREEKEEYYKDEIAELKRKISETQEFKEMADRLRVERDKLCSRLKEKDEDAREIIELKRKNCELKCEKLKDKMDADVYRKKFKELEGKVLIMNVEQDSGKIRGSEEKRNPNVGSSHFKRAGGKSKANTKSSKLSVIKKPFKHVKRLGRPFKDPNKPKRPLSSFLVFMEEFRQTYKMEHPKNKIVSVVGKAGGEKWKALSEAEKAPFVAMAEERKVEYEKKIRAYNKEQDEEEEEVEKSESEVNDDEDDDEDSEDEDEDDEEDSEDEDDDE